MEKELRSIETQFNLDDNKRTVSRYAIVSSGYPESITIDSKETLKYYSCPAKDI